MTGEEKDLLKKYLAHLNILGPEGFYPNFEAWYQEIRYAQGSSAPHRPWQRRRSCATRASSEANNIRIPNINDHRVRRILADCWEHTRDMEVPQFRDGECKVRQLWDKAVAEAMGWDSQEMARLRHLLHQEPHVRGLGYNQYGDEPVIEPADPERFRELADQW